MKTKKIISILTLICFLTASLLPDFAYASYQVENAKSVKMQDPGFITDSANIAKASIYDNEKNILFINIQDIHNNYSVQKNILSTIEDITKALPIDKIYIEGAAGNVNVSFLRSIYEKDPNYIETFFRDGYISAGEYFAIKHNDNNILFGIENEAIYNENIIRLNKLIANRELLSSELGYINSEISKLKNVYISKANEEFTSKLSSFKQYSTERYIFLTDFAKKNGILASNYDIIDGFVDVLNLSKKINFSKLNNSLGGIIESLKEKMPYSKYAELTEAFSKENKDKFYLLLSKAAHEYEIKQDKNISDFINYIELKQNIDIRNVIRQESSLISLINQELSLNDAEKDVLFLESYSKVLASYLTGEIMSDEYSYILSNKDRFKQAMAFFNIKLSDNFFEELKISEDFYDVNVKRNRIFIENILSDMKVEIDIKSGEFPVFEESGTEIKSFDNYDKIALVITGGFHTEGMNKLLDANNISNITLMPPTNLIDESNYSAVYEAIAKFQSYVLKNTIAANPMSSLNIEFTISKILSQTVKDTVLLHTSDSAEIMSALNESVSDMLNEAYSAANPGKEIEVNISSLDIKNSDSYSFDFAITKNGKTDQYQYYTDDNRQELKNSDGSIITSSSIKAESEKQKSKIGYYLYTIFGVNWEIVFNIPILGYIANSIMTSQGKASEIPHIKPVTALFTVSFAASLLLPLGPAVIPAVLISATLSGYIFSEAHMDIFDLGTDENIKKFMLGSIMYLGLMTPIIIAPLISLPILNAVLLGVGTNFVIHSLHNIAALITGKMLPGDIKKTTATEILKEDPVDVEKMRALLLDEEVSVSEKLKVLRFVSIWPYAGSIGMVRDLIEEELKSENPRKTLLSAALRTLKKLKRIGILSEKQAVTTRSIIGAIYEVIDKYDQGRNHINIRMNRDYSSVDIIFDFPEGESFVDADSFISVLKHVLRNFSKYDVEFDIDEDTFHEQFEKDKKIHLKFVPKVENLTSFWKSLALNDFRRHRDGTFRKMTRQEIYEKFEDRARLFSRNPNLYKFLFGEGEHPGALAVVKNPGKYGEERIFPAESNRHIENKYFFNENEFRTLIRRDEFAWDDFMAGLIDPAPYQKEYMRSYNDYKQIGTYDPYFSHYMPDNNVQHWIFLARAAGSVFTTAYMKGILRGFKDTSTMFFISRQSVGYNTWKTISIDTIEPLIKNPQTGKSVANFPVLQFTVLKALRDKYYYNILLKGDDGTLYKLVQGSGNNCHVIGENNKKLASVVYDKESNSIIEWTYKDSTFEINEENFLSSLSRLSGYSLDMSRIMDEVFEDFQRTGILERLKWKKDGKAAKICVVDEIAIGTFDFFLQYVVEEKTRKNMYEIDGLYEEVNKRMGGDFWHLYDKDPYEFTKEDGINAMRLYRTINEVRAEEDHEMKAVDVEIFIGGIKSREEILEGYPIVEEKKLISDFEMSPEEAKDAIYAIAEIANFMPHPVKYDKVHRDGPILFETDWVLLEKYLADLLAYNGVVEYYEREYKRIGIQALESVIFSQKVPRSIKKQALRDLKMYPYDTTIEYLDNLIKDTSLEPELIRYASKILDEIFMDYMSEMVDDYSDLEDPEYIVNDYLLVENEPFLRRYIGKTSSKEIEETIERALLYLEAKKANTYLIGIPQDILLKMNQSQIKTLRGMDYYFVPLRAEYDEQKRFEDFDNYAIPESNKLTIDASLFEGLHQADIMSVILDQVEQLQNRSIENAENMLINSQSRYYSEEPIYKGSPLYNRLINTNNFKVYKNLAGLRTEIYVDPTLNIDENDLDYIIRNIKAQHKLRSDMPEKIVIAKLDKSKYLFEDHITNGFIGVNASIAQDSQAHKYILETGLYHELTHELTGKKGDDFEAAQTERDIEYLKQTIKADTKNWIIDGLLYGFDSRLNTFNNNLEDVIRVYDTLLEASRNSITNKLITEFSNSSVKRRLLLIPAAFAFGMFFMPAASPLSFIAAPAFLLIAGISGVIAIGFSIYRYINLKFGIYDHVDLKLMSKPLMSNIYIFFTGIWMALNYNIFVDFHLPDFGHIQDFVGPTALAAYLFDAFNIKKTFSLSNIKSIEYKDIIKGLHKNAINRGNPVIAAISAGLFGIGFEFAQKFGWDTANNTLGTYDPLDLLAFSLGTFITLLVINSYDKRKQFNNFESIITFIEDTIIKNPSDENIIMVRNIIYRERFRKRDIGQEIMPVYIQTLEAALENALSYADRNSRRTKDSFEDESYKLREKFKKHILQVEKSKKKKRKDNLKSSQKRRVSDAVKVAAESALPQRRDTVSRFYGNEQKAPNSSVKGRNYFICKENVDMADLSKAYQLYSQGFVPYVISRKVNAASLMSEGFSGINIRGLNVYFKLSEFNNSFAIEIYFDHKDFKESAAKIIDDIQKDPALRATLIDYGNSDVLRKEKSRPQGLDFIDLADQQNYVADFDSAITVLSGSISGPKKINRFDYISSEDDHYLSLARYEALYFNKQNEMNFYEKFPSTFETVDCSAFSDIHSLGSFIKEHYKRGGINSFVLLNPDRKALGVLNALNRSEEYNINFIVEYKAETSRELLELKDRIIKDIQNGVSGYRIDLRNFQDMPIKETVNFLNTLRTEALSINPLTMSSTVLLPYMRVSDISTFEKNGYIPCFKVSPRDVASLKNEMYPNYWIEISLEGFNFYEDAPRTDKLIKDIGKINSKALSIDGALFAGEKVNGKVTFISDSILPRISDLLKIRSKRKNLSLNDYFLKGQSIASNMRTIEMSNIKAFTDILNEFRLEDIYKQASRDGYDISKLDIVMSEIVAYVNTQNNLRGEDNAMVFLESARMKYINSSDKNKAMHVAEMLGFLYSMIQKSISIKTPIYTGEIKGPEISMLEANNIYSSLKIEAAAILGKELRSDADIIRSLANEAAVTNNEVTIFFEIADEIANSGKNIFEIRYDALREINAMYQDAMSLKTTPRARALLIAASLNLFQLLLYYDTPIITDDTVKTRSNYKSIERMLGAA